MDPSATTTWQRHVPLEGGLNLRDLGGYPTADGREVRRGCVYRSANLCTLTDADHATLVGLGIRVVFDLRNEHERSTAPSRLPHGVELHERTSPTTANAGQTIEEQIATGSLPEVDDDVVLATYLSLIDRVLVPELRRILLLALDAPAHPLLFHCVAGKDRTGIAAALLLGLLAVDDETILGDYSLSSTYWAAPRLETLQAALAEHGVGVERVRPLLDARHAVMQRTIEHVHERWGGYDAYAIGCLGVDADLPAALRATLRTGAGHPS